MCIRDSVTRHGSTNSHTAILARTMNIPALIGVDFPEEGVDGQFGIVDGFDAKFFVEPDEDTKAEYRKLKEENEQKKRLLQELKGKENITKDGTKINLYANIGGVSDVANVLANDAGGIGLFRSCLLYTSKVVNSVGAGDSMVAGFVTGYLKTGSYKEAFQMGVCTGSASAFSEELATEPEVLALLDKNKGIFK